VCFFAENYIKYMSDNADVYIAISEAVRKAWIEKGLPEAKITKIYNGVSIENIQKSSIEQKKDKILKIIIVGTVCETKGQIQLIKALSRIPEDIKNYIYVDIVGNGKKEYIRKLRHLIKSFGLSQNINICGHTDHISELLKKYQVGIMASRSEGFGRVTIEYMMAGLCVIASDTGANQELVDDEKTGLIYRYNVPDSLADKIIEIYKDREKLIKLSEAGCKNARSNYTAEKNAQKIYELYQRLR